MRRSSFVVCVLVTLLCGVCVPSAAQVAESAAPDAVRCDASTIRGSEPPHPDGTPTEVTVGVRLADLTDIDDVNQTLTGEFLVRQRWSDPRLVGMAGCKLSRDRIWTPEIGFLNSGRLFTSLPDVVTVEADGVAVFLQSYYGTLSSYETFKNFPFDIHQFKIWLLSARYPSSKVKIIVDEQFTGRRELLNISDWDVGDVNAVSAEMFFQAINDKSSRFELRIDVARIHLYYIWKIFVPLLFIVIMSWAVFWINPVNFGPQIGLSATSMLTLIAFLFATTNIVPKLGYFTLFDILLSTSILFVFAAFLQTLLTTYLVSIDKSSIALRMDQFSRFVFPLAFIAVNWLVLAYY